jgi:hypothetical protein
MRCTRFTISFDLDYVDERTGQKMAQSLNAGNRDFILKFLQHTSARISIAEWSKDLEDQ